MIFHCARLQLVSFFVFFVATVSSTGCLAQEATSPAQESPSQSTSDARAEAPSIIVDPDKNSFRFFIDGKEVARIDVNGLQVRDSITYGGALTDIGAGGYPSQTEGKRDED